ncbi:MAG: hypothetical protein AAF696_36435, partial [Bacteroidota bacterium]
MFEEDSLLLNEKIKLNFNPFRGLEDYEIEEIWVPKSFSQKIYNQLLTEEKIIIELRGPKGFGKTTHLRFLHNRFSDAPMISLSDEYKGNQIKWEGTSFLFLDSIHHLNFSKRQKL